MRTPSQPNSQPQFVREMRSCLPQIILPQIAHFIEKSITGRGQDEGPYRAEAGTDVGVQGDRQHCRTHLPNLEIVAINDRSTDGAGDILNRLGSKHPGMRVIHVHDLPQGRRGKNHALHQGAHVASGDYLLFRGSCSPASTNSAINSSVKRISAVASVDPAKKPRNAR